MTNYGTLRDKQSDSRKERGLEEGMEGGSRGVEMNVCVCACGGVIVGGGGGVGGGVVHIVLRYVWCSLLLTSPCSKLRSSGLLLPEHRCSNTTTLARPPCGHAC